jgi:hypothetical protein
MHTLNPFESRSYNSKVTNWRILRLKGLKQTLAYLLAGDKNIETILRSADREIEDTKKAYADYLRVQFGVGVEPLTKIESNVWLGDVDENAWKRLLEKRGGCSCHLSPPCDNCVDPLTEEELNSVGYTYGT